MPLHINSVVTQPSFSPFFTPRNLICTSGHQSYHHFISSHLQYIYFILSGAFRVASSLFQILLISFDDLGHHSFITRHYQRASYKLLFSTALAGAPSLNPPSNSHCPLSGLWGLNLSTIPCSPSLSSQSPLYSANTLTWAFRPFSHFASRKNMVEKICPTRHP